MSNTRSRSALHHHPSQRLTIKCLTIIQIELEFGNVGFWGERKTRVPGEKPLGARKGTNNKLNPHMTPGPGIEPGTHWWEARALTTATSLLSIMFPKYIPQTNPYASQILQSILPLGSKCLWKSWTYSNKYPQTALFTRLLVYWLGLSVPAFSKVKARNRFLDIWNNIHLCDNKKMSRPGDSNFVGWWYYYFRQQHSYFERGRRVPNEEI